MNTVASMSKREDMASKQSDTKRASSVAFIEDEGQFNYSLLHVTTQLPVCFVVLLFDVILNKHYFTAEITLTIHCLHEKQNLCSKKYTTDYVPH